MSATTGTGSLRVSRTFEASPEEVYAAFTDPEALAQWMCPGDILETKAEIDVRPGGRMRIFMRGKDDYTIDHTGEYVEVDPPRRLAFTWTSHEIRGFTSLVTVELVPKGEGATELTLTHERLPDEKAVRNHERGWTRCVEKLGPWLRAQKETPA